MPISKLKMDHLIVFSGCEIVVAVKYQNQSVAPASGPCAGSARIYGPACVRRAVVSQGVIVGVIADPFIPGG